LRSAHEPNPESGSSGTRLRQRGLALALGSLAALPLYSFADDHGLSASGSLAYTSDDNVNRTIGHGTPQYSDQFASVSVGTNLFRPLSHHSRLVVHGSLGLDNYSTFTGLSRASLGGTARYQYRGSGGFGVPIYSILGTFEYQKFQSDMRTGYRVVSGGSVRKRYTDRINTFAALTYNYYSSASAVFDTEYFSLRGNLDYAMTKRQTLYFSLDYRQGDIVATADPLTPYASWVASHAQTIENDDVFTGLTAYRLSAGTQVYTIGYNFQVNENNSLDASARAVRSSANGGFQYATNLLSVAWLWRL
jgi:hypothetical protein